VQERAEVSLEGYGLFLLRADALEKDQATLLEPSSLILPLGLSLEVLLFFIIVVVFFFFFFSSSQGNWGGTHISDPNHIARIRSSFDRARKQRRPPRQSILSFTQVSTSFRSFFAFRSFPHELYLAAAWPSHIQGLAV
jgi:hypothetical protein